MTQKTHSFGDSPPSPNSGTPGDTHEHRSVMGNTTFVRGLNGWIPVNPTQPSPTQDLETRVQRLEQAILALAEATQDWAGGANDGRAYPDGCWRKSVLNAVREVRRG